MIAMGVLFTGCNDISTVKNGVLEDFSESLTVGQALETWKTQECLDTKWDSFTTDRGEKVVSFTCPLDVESIKTSSDKAITDEDAAKILAEYKKAKSESSKAIEGSHEAVNSPNAQAITDMALSKIDASYEAEKKMVDINSKLARKKLTNAELKILFLIAANGKSFSPNSAGIEYTFEDKKTYFKDIHPKIALLKAFQNQKIEMNVDHKTYLNRE